MDKEAGRIKGLDPNAKRWWILTRKGHPEQPAKLGKRPEPPKAAPAHGDIYKPWKKETSHLHGEKGKKGIHYFGTLNQAKNELRLAKRGKSHLKVGMLKEAGGYRILYHIGKKPPLMPALRRGGGVWKRQVKETALEKRALNKKLLKRFMPGVDVKKLLRDRAVGGSSPHGAKLTALEHRFSPHYNQLKKAVTHTYKQLPNGKLMLTRGRHTSPPIPLHKKGSYLRKEAFYAAAVNGKVDMSKVSFLAKTAREGHWRKLPPGQMGHDQNGNPSSGQTWIHETIKPWVQPKPHQAQAMDDFDQAPEGGMIAAHGTGTGKTPLSMMIAEKLRSEGKADRFLVITPASLRTNFVQGGIKKFTTSSVEQPARPDQVGDSTYVVVSLENFRDRPDEWLAAVKPSGIVVDEVHRAKDPSSKTFKALIYARKQVPYFLGLTGSLVSNQPADVEPMVDLASGQDRSLGGPQEFKKKYTKVVRTTRAGLFGGQVQERTLRNTKELGKALHGRVNYVGHQDVEGLPQVDEQIVQVPMSKRQMKLLDMALSGIDPSVKRNIFDRVLPMSEKGMMNVLTSIQKARAISNSIAQGDPTVSLQEASEITPKLKRVISDAVQHMEKTPDGRVVMFSNRVNGGLNELAAGMEFHRIPFAVFTSASNKTWGDRDENVQKFLSGDAKVIIVTPAGVEGLNLNKATMFQMLDEHYNPERNEQAKARAIRSDSLLDRPEEERVVQVRRYQSVVPRTFADRVLRRESKGGVDEWVHSLQERKQTLNKELRDVANGTYKERNSDPKRGIFSRIFGG